MKFVLSDKDRSVNTTLNVVYGFFVFWFVGMLSAYFSLENPTGHSGDDAIHPIRFFVLFTLGISLFLVPLFLKKFGIIKWLALPPFLLSLIIFSDVFRHEFLHGQFHFSGSIAFILFPLLVSGIIFLTGYWKERYHKRCTDTKCTTS